MAKFLSGASSSLKTFLCFIIACLLLPFLLLSTICVHYSNEFVNYVLSIKYPTLTISKSKKIRTLIDTPRNAGIFHFLLQIKGSCDFEKIKKYYTEKLTDARDKAGYLKFPKLRQKLVTCWGHYAWVNDTSSFNINNQLLLNTQTGRGGRPVNDSNLQEFVSDLVTKYIPSDFPQWQVIVIPVTNSTSTSKSGDVTEQEEDDHFYILVKVHHLLIAEEEDLHISELLMLEDSDRKQLIDIDELLDGVPKIQNLSYFVRKPIHIERLLFHIWKLIVNRWNAFIYQFDSLEAPDGHKTFQITNIKQLLSIFIIIIVNAFVNYWKEKKKLRRRHRSQKQSHGRRITLARFLLKEMYDRNFSWDVARNAIRSSLHPANLGAAYTKFLWHMNVKHLILFPYHGYCELMACRDLIFKGQTKLTSTYCGRLSVYLPMMIYAQMEFIKICYELYTAPVNIYKVLFESPSKELNILQTKSYSGRKIVSFSKSIDAAALRSRLNFNEERRESDFTLACLAGAMKNYFDLYQDSVPVPQILNTTCRTIGKGYLTDNFNDKVEHIGGVVFLQLPIKSPDLKQTQQIHAIVEDIRQRQTMIYLASMGQTKFDLLTALIPRVFTKICINFFSFNFPVTITEIHGPTSEFRTVWGQHVEDVLLFRPPQSKTCLSLNIHRFGNKYRLAIMADTQLGPDNAKICHSFEDYMENVTF